MFNIQCNPEILDTVIKDTIQEKFNSIYVNLTPMLKQVIISVLAGEDKNVSFIKDLISDKFSNIKQDLLVNLIEALAEELNNPPVDEQPVDEPVEKQPVDEPIEKQPVDEPIEKHPVDEPIEVDEPIFVAKKPAKQAIAKPVKKLI